MFLSPGKTADCCLLLYLDSSAGGDLCLVCLCPGLVPPDRGTDRSVPGQCSPHQAELLPGWLPVDRTGHLGSLLPPHLLLSRHHRGARQHPQTVQSEGESPLLCHHRVAAGPGAGLGGNDAGHLSLFPHRDRKSSRCPLCHPTLGRPL